MVKQRTIYLTLFVATFAVSWAAILIKLTGAGPLPTAFYRMAFSAIILAVPSLPAIRRAVKILDAGELFWLIMSGIFLGLHFAVWVTSLFYTTISNSAILVATQPVWVLILEATLLKERIPRRSVIGMIVALAGMLVISRGDFDMGRDYIIGDLLALAGALFAALYLFIGRRLRAKLDNLGYITPVYTTAALVLIVISLFYGVNLTHYPLKTWLIFLLLALIPTVVGHSLYNWLLKYVQAHIVATTVLGEPIGATILAIFFFNEIPGGWTLIGGIMILSGIFVVLKRKRKEKIIIPE